MTSQTCSPTEADAAYGWPDRLAAWTDARLTRMGLIGRFRRDCALAVVLCLVTTGLLLLLFAEATQTPGLALEPFQVSAAIVLSAVQSLLLCVRRVHPVLCLWLVALPQVALFAVLPAAAAVRGFAPAIAAYGCGALLPARRAVRVVAAVTLFESAGLVLVSFLPGQSAAPSVAGQLVSGVLTYAASALFGAYIATRRQNASLERLRAAEAVETQRARADAAIGLERSRMARELHDIAAHHLSGMVVQAAVVERLIDRDPQAAKEAAAWIRAQGRETLHNLRLVVGALRGPEGGDLDDEGAPVPGLGVLDRLVRTARELGTPVELVRDGEPVELPPIADVTFYRVVQEALANVREHAPGAPARIVLRYGAADVSLEIENKARPAPDRPRVNRGFGLAGMQERAQLIGATLDAGPTPSGGWRVSLRLPLDGETTSPHAGAHRSVPQPGTRLAP
ncbi:sensor histidine kinase [Pseudonocardia cypriaca]|uniref:histidine kinase n=1 Tax=Pseudonocardia cypriaca TaxID=882449 RepID=A0A543G9X1_9PSEU|nr:histidine kinase [Pseudonocardia cypriaca]TQM42883.1 signal transduction histidine kinase [Pseudonocardia cypriaca]